MLSLLNNPQPKRSLEEVLLAAQRVGTLGDRPISEVISHSRQFVAALPPGPLRVIDIGTGAGIPGLVIALDRPDISIVLADRRETRMDALARAVVAMGLSHQVTVLTGDVSHLGQDPQHQGNYDIVVSRGFASPEITATAARPLLKNGGSLIVSEPPLHDPSRWGENMLTVARFAAPEYSPGVVRIQAKA